MKRYDWLTSLTLLTLAVDCITCEIIALGKKNYSVTFELQQKKLYDRLELDCGVSGKNITWYFKHLADDTLYHAYPFQFCNSTGCGLEDSNTVLVVKRFFYSSTGDYICVDGQYGSGVTVMEACPTTTVTSLPFNNVTASVGNNATFSCEVDVGTLGCEINVKFLVKRNGTIILLSDGQYTRYEGNNVIEGVNITILDVRKTDFNIIIQCMIYDVDAGSLVENLSAMLLYKGVVTVIDARFDVKTIVVVFSVVAIIIVFLIVCLYFHRRIYYYCLYCTNKLPDKGNKISHGLILYKDDMDTYCKVQKLKASLYRYNLREYPPGPHSSDQQAGYSQLGLLDQICQECTCLIVFGEVGELEGRCLSCFEGRKVTHVVLSKSGEKQRHFIYWPFDENTAKCTGGKRRQWENFIFQVKSRLPHLESRHSNSQDVREEENLTSI